MAPIDDGDVAAPSVPLGTDDAQVAYAMIGPLTGRNGRMAEIATVWIILVGGDAPRFVTVYPKD